MALSDAFWKHPLTAELYHNTDKASEKLAEESLIAEFLKTQASHVLIDLGIGTGRELEWVKEVESTETVIGIDYSEHMVDKCMQIWKNYSKKLILFTDDFEQLKNVTQALSGEPRPAVFLSLSNTIGNMPPKRRQNALNKIAKTARKGDKVVLALYKRKDNHQNEVEYYKKNYPLFNRIIWDLHGETAAYKYDEENHNIVIGTETEPVYISHRWTKNEVNDFFTNAGLKLEKIIDGEQTYIAIGVNA